MRYGKYDGHIDALLNDPDYHVRDNGTVWGKARYGEKWEQKGSRDWHGYYCLNYRHGSSCKLSIARIVYRKFNGKIEPEMTIDHVDGDKGNNRPENLEQVTHQENIRRYYERRYGS